MKDERATSLGASMWLSSKNPLANTGDTGLISEWGRSPGRGHGNPLQYSCLENPKDRGALWAKSLNHFELTFVYGVRVCSSLHWFAWDYPTLPVPLAEEIVFSPLYIFVFFVEDYLTVGVRVFFWALYSVPLIHMSVFVPVPYYFDYCSFVVLSEVWRLMPPASIFFFRIASAILGLLWLHTNFRIICSSSMKNVIDNLIGIVFNL